MFFIILCAVMVVAGIWIGMKDEYGESLLPLFLIVVGACLLLCVSLPAIFMQTTEATKQVISYNQDKVYIENAYGNNNITDSERTATKQKIIEDNTIILTHRKFADNFFVGAWYSKRIGELEPFDMNKINIVNMKVDVRK